MDAEERRAYGDTLLNAMSIGGSCKDSLASVTFNEGRERLKERLDAIMKFKNTTQLTSAISAAFVFILCFLSTAAGAYAAAPSTNPNGMNAALKQGINTALNQSKNAIWNLG